MEVTARRNIKSGKEYDHLFPPAEGSDVLIKKGATLEDTIEFLPEVILKTLDQTKRIAPLFKSKTVKETCRKIWQWIYENIRYVKDERGKEQIKSPSRTWRDRSGDCDDFTVLISSILCNLGIVPHKLRIALYSYENGYQHIYPVAKDENGETIIIDCVTEQFNYEVPYLKKKEKKMDLYYLNGIGNQDENLNIDAEDLMKGEVGELGLKLKKLKDTKLVQKLKSGLHNINKINPATALLRAGVLASMKMNLMNVAGMITGNNYKIIVML